MSALQGGTGGPERARPLRRALVAGLAVASVLLLGCVAPYEGNPQGKRVGIWGDSTVELGREELHQVLGDRYQVSIEARPGHDLASLQDVATHYAVSNPEVVVISAGTIDAYIIERPWDGFRQLLAIGDTISKYQGCVVWVNVMNGEGFPEPGVDARAIARANGINAALVHWSTRYPNLRIVDWSGEVLEQGVDALLLKWNPHANETGQMVMAQLVDEAIATC